MGPPLPKGRVGGLGSPSLLTTTVRQAKTKGMQSGVDIGVKYSEKQQRNFDEAKMKAGQCVIGLQVGCPPWAEVLGEGGLVLSNPRHWHSPRHSWTDVRLKVPQVSSGSRTISAPCMTGRLERLRLGWVGECWMWGDAWGITWFSPDPLARWAQTSAPASRA